MGLSVIHTLPKVAVVLDPDGYFPGCITKAIKEKQARDRAICHQSGQTGGLSSWPVLELGIK